ncbi:MAG: hypothetical protein E3J35_01060 [Methanomassiliicoccales archaeon]|nr:MAG: hypothetical protein E3J35_01060 [Methanomassiliicoccales archaeon]
MDIGEKGALIYCDKVAEEKAVTEGKREMRFNLISSMLSMFVSLSLIIALVVLWLVGYASMLNTVIILILIAIISIFGIGDYIDLKRPDTTNRVRVYENCLSFPTRRNVLHPLVEKSVSFKDIESIYLNTRRNLDYITVLCRDGRRIPIGKVFISDLNTLEKVLEDRVKVVRNVDMEA